jgi:hypothetical protein
MCLSFLLVIISVLTSSSPALSQFKVQSWLNIRLTFNSGVSLFPTVAASGDNIHVVWRDQTPGNSEIFYRQSRDNGHIWSMIKHLTKNTGESWQPTIAVSGDNVHVVWMDDTPGNWEVFYKRSTDSGITWGKQKRLTKNAGESWQPAIAVSDLTKNTGNSWQPSIAVSGNDIHVAWQDNTHGNYEIYYKRSTNNGKNWGKRKRLTRNAGLSESPAIAVMGDNIHVVWSDNTAGNDEILYRRSRNNGTTWRKIKNLTKNAGNSTEPSIAVLGSDVHVVWSDRTQGNDEIYYKPSANNGRNWGKRERLTHNLGDSGSPACAVTGLNVHVVWFDETPGLPEIFYSRGP